MKNLNEEIKRIKSLFNEDRLFGNLVNEATNPDTSNDGKIDSTEFDASGNEIDTDEAMEFLIASDYTVTKPNPSDDKLTVVDVCSKKDNMKYIYNWSKNNNFLNKSGVRDNFNSSDGICYFYWKSTNAPSDGDFKVKKVVAWDDDYITFYIQLPYEINLGSPAEVYKSFEDLTTKMDLYVKANEVYPGDPITCRYLKFSGKLDYSNLDVDNIEFKGFFDKDMKKTSFQGILFEQIEDSSSDKRYNPLVDQNGVPTGPREFGIGMNLFDMIKEVTGVETGFAIDKLLDKL